MFTSTLGEQVNVFTSTLDCVALGPEIPLKIAARMNQAGGRADAAFWAAVLSSCVQTSHASQEHHTSAKIITRQSRSSNVSQERHTSA